MLPRRQHRQHGAIAAPGEAGEFGRKPLAAAGIAANWSRILDFRGTERLEDTVRRAGRRLSLSLTAGGALVATAITASSTHVAGWIPVTLGTAGGLLAVGLVADLVRRGR